MPAPTAPAMATTPATSTTAPEPRRAPIWVPCAWLALAGCLIPVGFDVGLPFQVSPADVLLPLMIPIVLFGLPRPKVFRHLVQLVSISLLIVLGWAALDEVGGASELQSWLFFWKSWIALLLAHGLILHSRDPQRRLRTVLNCVAWAQVSLIVLIGLGWAVEGELVLGSVSGGGNYVTGFSAGSWDLPVKLYGSGQVNVTANLLALAGPVLAYRAAGTTNVVLKLFWVAWIPVSWWFIIYSGSRGSLVTVGLFVALLFLATDKSLGSISIVKLGISVGLAAVVVSQAQVILDASPKYARTIENVNEGDASAVASGRTEINALSLADIRRSPLVGTAFGDYGRFHTSQDTPWVDSSPHNAYVGPIHKMGIPLGVGYLILMWKALPFRRVRGLPGVEFLTLPLAVPLAVGILPVGDALTTSVLAATILTVSGAVIAARQVSADEESEQPVGKMVEAVPKAASKE